MLELNIPTAAPKSINVTHGTGVQPSDALVTSASDGDLVTYQGHRRSVSPEPFITCESEAPRGDSPLRNAADLRPGQARKRAADSLERPGTPEETKKLRVENSTLKMKLKLLEMRYNDKVLEVKQLGNEKARLACMLHAKNGEYDDVPANF